jgi:hypothetical protein
VAVYSTNLHTNSTKNTENGTYITIKKIRSTGRALSLRVIPWHLPYNCLAFALQLYSFFNLDARWVWVVNATPRPLLRTGKSRYPWYRRLGGPQDRSERVRKISPPPGFDPRTVHPVGSRYTDCGIPAPIRSDYE